MSESPRSSTLQWPLGRPTLLVATFAVFGLIHAPTAVADNKRLNDNAVLGIYNLQHQAGCRNDVTIDMRLQTAAEWHTRDLMTHPELSGDTGSDGSTPQSRAAVAGFTGQVAQTIAIYPSFALNNRELMLMWQDNPAYVPIMTDCAFSKMGVWSENSFDRSILVAVYGAPS